MTTTRKELIQSISDRIADYREGAVPRRSPVVVEQWVMQFPKDAQDGILCEMNHVLAHSYIAQKDMSVFLRNLVKNVKLCGSDPREFWTRANLLDIQQGGNSQREMLTMFSLLLEQEVGVIRKDSGSKDGPFIYLDDAVFGGGRVLHDISAWITQKSPKECEVHIVAAVLYQSGIYYVGKKIEELNAKIGKKVKLTWWRILQLENRRYYKDNSDVLWPTVAPSGPLADTYIRYMTEEEPKYKVELRAPGSVGEKKLFSSDAGRVLLEQQFLDAGLSIRDMCTNLPVTARPLGSTLLKTFGFGATIVTFRNCPNNCPLVFWADAPWYPLFPRSTNNEATMKRLVESFSRAKQGRA